MLVTLDVQLDPEICDRLKAIGEARQLSESAVARAAIEDFLARVQAETGEDMQPEPVGADPDNVAAWLVELAQGKRALADSGHSE